ncbi:MAG: dihydrofolate synthase/folylpolyglutamate synthase [Candidatus Paceibacteria bacterium]|jgi:dihydrofolate synthase/folylpolyglutamate synthase
MGKDGLDLVMEQMDSLVNWERRDRSGGMDRNLEPIKDLLQRLENPERSWRGVLVAGTKGKGSVCALLGAGLERAGLSVGIYASPHVQRVTERVRIDGQEVQRGELAGALEEALAARAALGSEGAPGGEATWFDLMTTAAFLLFRKKEVDWGVIEAGIGGRLDSTRALDAVLSVVTNVELEHTATLGSDRGQIAFEKGSVVAEDGVLLTGIQPDDEEPFGQFVELAERAQARLVSVPQRGSLWERNLALAEAALNELGRSGFTSADGEALWRSFLDREAMERARLPARMERFSIRGVPVVLDSGHVAESAKLVLEELERAPELGRKPKLILALGAEKDAPAVLEAFLGHVDRLLCTTAPEGRLLGEQDLAQAAFDAGHDPEAWKDAREALGEAVADAEEGGGWVLVFGSFYLSSVLREGLLEASAKNPHSPEC